MLFVGIGPGCFAAPVAGSIAATASRPSALMKDALVLPVGIGIGGIVTLAIGGIVRTASNLNALISSRYVDA